MDADLYQFPAGPDGVEEWSGTPLGDGQVPNTITRLRGRTTTHDKALDSRPVERDRLLQWAEQYAQALGASLFQHDVVVHGVRVRALTNSPHLSRFFQVNWFTPVEWRDRTGQSAPTQPQLVAYALNGVTDQPASASYSRLRNTVLFVNTSYYGQLKSWVLGAVGRLLTEERGIHSIHGACVEYDGAGILYVAPTGTGKSTSSYGLMQHPGARFHSDDWVYVRYTWPGPGGEPLAPIRLSVGGREVAGAQAIAMLLARQPASGRFSGYRLSGEAVEGDLAELDQQAAPTAYAYTSEKVFYLRTNLAESFPLAARSLLQSPAENVPDVQQEFIDRHRPALRAAAAAVGEGRGFNAGLQQDLARLIAFDNARAMLDAEQIFGRERVVWNPMEPTQLSAVFLLQRDAQQPQVLAPLNEDQFLATLLRGVTPTGTEETAYNAYRAVDDPAERRAISALFADSQTGNIYRRLTALPAPPGTLVDEATLFRAMHRACRTYVLNTILQRDPNVASRGDAVALTLRLIVAATQGKAERAFTLDDYQTVLTDPVRGG